MCSSHVASYEFWFRESYQVTQKFFIGCDDLWCEWSKCDMCDASLYLTQITLVYFKCHSFHFSTVTPKIVLNSLQVVKWIFPNQNQKLITKTINSLSIFLTLDNFSPVLDHQVHHRVFFRLQFFRQSFLRQDLDYPIR